LFDLYKFCVYHNVVVRFKKSFTFFVTFTLIKFKRLTHILYCLMSDDLAAVYESGEIACKKNIHSTKFFSPNPWVSLSVFSAAKYSRNENNNELL
jgi:hypothetical protein